MTPESKARQTIDSLLAAAGWMVQEREEMNLGAGLGVAVREYPLPAGPCDYLLFVDRKACGVIEAKPEGVTLTGVAEQSAGYMGALPAHLQSWAPNLLFDYESTGAETLFRDLRDPEPRSRRVFAFHRPEALLATLEKGSSLRARLQSLPPLDPRGLRACQVEAIEGLEASLKRADPRALVQMATGAGKTFTACNLVMRLLAHADIGRVLFLVDRKNLGDQTRKEFQRFQPPGTGKLFTELYNIQHLSGRRVDPSSSVVISTVQRLYATLRGEDIDEELDETSGFELGDPAEERPVTYNPDIPIETFDLIIVDECHRSIYGVWRQVLDYFDAFVVGLTATPSGHTLGFFNRNLVSEYPYERSVIDEVNVGHEIFRIRTERGEQGGRIKAGYSVPKRDRHTRRERYETLEADLAYTKKDLDRSVLVPNQIRTVLEAYRDALPTQLFPGRKEVPKTLIFAKDDHHAEEIVKAAWEVFGKGNAFAKKITYRVTGTDPAQLINEFRNEYNPRIAVTVDMIATGTDIKPLEVVMFLRDVRSEIYYEQMKGRGARTIGSTELRQVTPDAAVKDRFIVIDAVGVSESAKTPSQPLERKRTVPFDTLLDRIAAGARTDDALSSLAGRLAKLNAKLPPEERARVEAVAGRDLHAIARTLFEATDADAVEAEARRRGTLSDAGKARVAADMKEAAARLFDDPRLRRLLKELQHQSELTIDCISTDRVISGGFEARQAEEKVAAFRRFLEEKGDELAALQILYGRPYAARRLTYAMVDEMRAAMTRPPWELEPLAIWAAYQRLERGKVRDPTPGRVLADLIALTRFALGLTGELHPFSVDVERQFNLWIGREKKAGRPYTDEQMNWLRLFRDHIAVNVEMTPADLQEIGRFAERGGRIAANRLFGRDRLPALLDDLTETLQVA
ncbi:type I restriction endonuclease subunit R [Azospirillum lipoferum]|uniref:Type I site-specific restriction-modification system, restriction subunit n=1 Tax=Azospirillum lipoferum (strain 4B) TaxID=862719 RepID=G7Z1V6_AZOL4|nr:DEAD/DEAH box helicase family protein [Azospirillum lipoferum]CBS87295.1 Type I site-specific restriction-modification system, restriction subunit [Azospirillum lipoferum 4B]